MRVVYFCMGWVLVALGVIGAVTPLLPTTIFLIGAAGCFARSSPRLEAWLLDHPQFGKTLRDWRSDGAISRPAKMMACAGMTFGFVAFWFSAHPSLLAGGRRGGAAAGLCRLRRIASDHRGSALKRGCLDAGKRQLARRIHNARLTSVLAKSSPT